MGDHQRGTHRCIELNGYRIHYVQFGSGQPLILIPGAFSTHGTWNRLIPYLSDRFRVIAVDYLGTGNSDKPKSGFAYTIEEQADLFAEMITQLGGSPVDVAGVSYGGVIALNLAARYPRLVRRVVSIEGSVVIPEHLPSSSFETMLKYPLLGTLLIRILKTGLLNRSILRLAMGTWYSQMTRSEKSAMLAELREDIRSAQRIPWYRISISPKTSRDFSEEAKGITAPVLYLYGDQSDFRSMIRENVTFFEQYLPHVRITGVPDGIHDLQRQKPRETAALINDFLS